MTMQVAPSAVIFKDTAVDSANVVRVSTWQDTLAPIERSCSLNVSKPFTMKPFGSASYSKTEDNDLIFRNYLLTAGAIATTRKVPDMLQSDTHVFSVEVYGAVVNIHKTSKTSYADSEIELVDAGEYDLQDSSKFMAYDKDGNIIVLVFYENGDGHVFKVFKIDPVSFEVSDSYNTDGSNYDVEIKDVRIAGDKLFAVGYKDGASNGILFVFDIDAFDSAPDDETLTGILPESLEVITNETLDIDILLIGSSDLISVYQVVISTGDFLPLSSCVPDSDSGTCYSIQKRMITGIYNDVYSVTGGKVNRFDPQFCIKSPSTGTDLMMSKTFNVDNFYLKARFIPENNDTTKQIFEIENTFRIILSASNVLTVDLYVVDAWVNMATSGTLDIKARDTHDIIIRRTSDVWTVTLNGTTTAMTDGDEYDTVFNTTGDDDTVIFTDEADNIWLRSFLLILGTETVCDITFNYSASGIHSNAFGTVVDSEESSNSSYALFRYYDIELTGKANTIGGVISGQYLYTVRDTGARDNSISKITLELSSEENSGNIWYPDGTYGSFVFSKNMIVSDVDEIIYFSGMASLTVSMILTRTFCVGKIGTDLSYEINKRYCDFRFAPTVSGIFTDVWVVDSENLVALVGVGFVEAARTIPYGTIIMEQGHTDYMRMSGTPVTKSVYVYKKISPWESFAGTKYAYSATAGTFTESAGGSYKRLEKLQKVQSVSEDYDSYYDTINFYYDVSGSHLVQNNPIALYLASAVSMMATEVFYTLDSNYRMNIEEELKINGQEAETSSFVNTLIYAVGSKQLEVSEVEAINTRDHKCIKFRIKAKIANPAMAGQEGYDEWRIFELKYTPSDLFYVEGE